MTITANNDSKTYGTRRPSAATAFTATGLVTANGDTITGVTESQHRRGDVGGGRQLHIVASSRDGHGAEQLHHQLRGREADREHEGPDHHSQRRTKTYGQTVAFAGTEFSASGLVNTDAVSSVTLTSAGAAATATVAGSQYDILATAAVGTGLGNYAISYAVGKLTVNKATPVISWLGMPSSMNQGSGLTATQLNAVAVVGSSPVAGAITYSLPSGVVTVGTAVYGVGAFNMLASFSPTDLNYTAASSTQTLTVDNVGPTVTSIALPSGPEHLGRPQRSRRSLWILA